MRQGLPQSVRDALVRQGVGQDHPSADLLNAYAEHELAGGEQKQVTAHLARRCGRPPKSNSAATGRRAPSLQALDVVDGVEVGRSNGCRSSDRFGSACQLATALATENTRTQRFGGPGAARAACSAHCQ